MAGGIHVPHREQGAIVKQAALGLRTSEEAVVVLGTFFNLPVLLTLGVVPRG